MGCWRVGGVSACEAVGCWVLGVFSPMKWTDMFGSGEVGSLIADEVMYWYLGTLVLGHHWGKARFLTWYR